MFVQLNQFLVGEDEKISDLWSQCEHTPNISNVEFDLIKVELMKWRYIISVILTMKKHVDKRRAGN